MASELDIPESAPRPRLCHMVKRDNFNGYGFNLHAQKIKPGQFIGIVDAGSPAEVAGLREGDRIIEVNGSNISQENHKQVVERIKAIPNETRQGIHPSVSMTHFSCHKNVKIRPSLLLTDKSQKVNLVLKLYF
jgi:Na(+)/H(+) exchange regulatory cofactor NHE-RF2